MKVRKDDHPRVPRSLFDRPLLARSKLMKMKQQQGFGMKPGLQKTHPGLPQRPPELLGDQPEWLIHEDWALLQVSASVRPIVAIVGIFFCGEVD